MPTPLPTNYDLHTHSHFSDGALSPTELLMRAQERGISHLALTDHDSVSGLEEAYQASQVHRVNLIPGIEFSCHWNFQLVHLVGLSIDPDNSQLQAGVEENKARRWQRADAIHADLKKRGYDVQDKVEALLVKDSVPTRPHFAQALVESGYAKNKKQAFKRFLVPGKPGYIAMQWPSLAEAAGWIQTAGGVAVLAHPMRYRLTRTKLIRLIKDMLDVGVNALEVATPITEPQQMIMLAQLCKEHNLFASRGSDFHSDDQPWAKLGGAPLLPEAVQPVWDQFNPTINPTPN